MARVATLAEHGYMGPVPVIPYVDVTKPLTRENVPRTWLPPKIKYVPSSGPDVRAVLLSEVAPQIAAAKAAAIAKASRNRGTRSAAKLPMKELTDIKHDVDLCAKPAPKVAPPKVLKNEPADFTTTTTTTIGQLGTPMVLPAAAGGEMPLGGLTPFLGPLVKIEPLQP
jgi:hypothetical protein